MDGPHIWKAIFKYEFDLIYFYQLIVITLIITIIPPKTGWQLSVPVTRAMFSYKHYCMWWYIICLLWVLLLNVTDTVPLLR